MSTSCMGFRQQLEALLGGRPDPERLTVLGWHEHLLSCGACREILEQEEALELLLASLPDPQLPPDLSRRLASASGGVRILGRERRSLGVLARPG